MVNVILKFPDDLSWIMNNKEGLKWSNDGHFKQQDKVVVYTTKDMAKKIS